jgi:hypothetical protein
MGEFDYRSDDEVFNLLTRKVGVVINVKEINSSLGSNKKYVRVYIKPDLPDEIWAVDEIALWTRHKKMMIED